MKGKNCGVPCLPVCNGSSLDSVDDSLVEETGTVTEEEDKS